MGTGRPDEGFRITYGSTSNQATWFVRIVPVYNLTRFGPTTATPIENHTINTQGVVIK